MISLFIAFFLLFTITSFAQKKLTDFKLVDMNGDTLTSDSLKGKYVYINVWETTCQPCLAEIPILNYAIGKTEDIILLSVTADKRAKVASTLEKHPLNFRIITDAENIVQALETERYPSHYFIDTSGSIEKFDFPLGITFGAFKTKREAKKARPKKKEWNSIMVEENKEIFYQKLLSLKHQ